MILKKLNGEQFKELLTNGVLNLKANYEEVDSLNVFPVPDGDTGTNMKLTYSNGLKTISDDDAPVGKIADESIRKKYVGKSVSKLYKFGEQSPIKYIWNNKEIEDDMKFSAVVGNPPYQVVQATGNNNTAFASAIYPFFIEFSDVDKQMRFYQFFDIVQPIDYLIFLIFYFLKKN